MAAKSGKAKGKKGIPSKGAKKSAKPIDKNQLSKSKSKVKMKMKMSSKTVARTVAKTVAKKVVAKAAQGRQSGVTAFLTPLDDRVVIAPTVAGNKTAGGLIIPDSATQKPIRGTVLAKGRGHRNKKGKLRPLDVNVGDEVLFAEFAGTKITFDGNEFLILREADVLGVVV
jgi:chaperonin GroES